MSRVLNEQQAGSSVPEVLFSHIQCTTQRTIDPSSLYRINYLTGEQRIVRKNIAQLTSVKDTLQYISLPANLAINNGHVEVNTVVESLSQRRR